MKNKKITQIGILFSLCTLFMSPHFVYAEDYAENTIITEDTETNSLYTENEYNDNSAPSVSAEQIDHIAVDSLANTEKHEEAINDICTVNIRCYPQQEFYDYQETISCILVPAVSRDNEDNVTTQQYQFNLDSVNNYNRAINVAPGKYYVIATVDGNTGVFRFYANNENALECKADQPVSFACAYGNDDFIDQIKNYLPVADVYSDKTTNDLLLKTPIEIVESEVDYTEYNIMPISEKDTDTEENALITPRQDNSEQKRNNDWVPLKLGISFVLLGILFYIVRKQKQHN